MASSNRTLPRFLEPYTDRALYQRVRFLGSWQNIRIAVTELDKRNLQLFTHAIGDYAIRTALDAYEFARKEKSH